MQRRDNRFLFSPSDLGNFLACEHLTQLDVGLALRDGRRPSYENAYAELLRTKGEEHEQAFLESLRATGRQVVEVRLNMARDFEDGTRRTADAMRAGADYVYQAVFLSEGWRGIADFLERVDRPSALGDWSYQVLDTKLARHPRPEHALQLSFYSQALADTQEVAPDLAYVVLGTRERVAIRLADVTAYFRRVRERFGAAVGTRPATGPYPCHHCSFCDYRKPCDDRLEREDHIVRVAGIQRPQVKRLLHRRHQHPRRAGPDTGRHRRAQDRDVHVRGPEGAGGPAAHPAAHRLARVASARRRGRSRLRRASRRDRPVTSSSTSRATPSSSPHAASSILFGVLLLDGSEPRYQPFWGHDRDGERRAFESLVDLIHARLAEHPDLHVYHFSGSEPSTLKRLMAEYVSREAQVDDLLRRKVFVDLHTILRRALRAGVPSYSLKDVEALFGFTRNGPVQSGTQAILHYERWMRRRDQTLLDEIAAYNGEDCRATLGLLEWLHQVRPPDLPWPEPPEAQPLSPRPRRPSMRGSDCARRSSREPSPGHRGGSRASCSSITGARRVPSGGPTSTASASRRKSCRRTRRRSPIWRLIAARPLGRSSARSFIPSPFPSRITSSGPDFRCTIPRPASPPGRSSRSTIRAAPSASCVCSGARRSARVPCRRRSSRAAPSRPGRRARPSCASAKRSAPAMGAIRPSGPSSRGSGPRIRGLAPGARIQTTDLDAMKALALGLDASYLFIQGPPGTGKTWTGARIVVHLLATGGVSASRPRATRRSTTCSPRSRECAGDRRALQGAEEVPPTIRSPSTTGELITSDRDNRDL